MGVDPVPGTFTLQDWDDITNELKRFWSWEDVNTSRGSKGVTGQ